MGNSSSLTVVNENVTRLSKFRLESNYQTELRHL